MVRRVHELEEGISALERRASAAVSSLHRVRMRTSRVLAATSAFTALQSKLSALHRVLRTVSGLPQISEDSVDRDDIERELARLRDELHQLEARFSRELQSCSSSKPPRPAVKRSKPWWRFWG